MNTKICEWYKTANPKDTEVNEQGLINKDVTFADIYNALKNKEDVYKILGINDSTVRQYIFSELADKLHCDYDSIYNMWLERNEVPKSNSFFDSQTFLVSVPIEGELVIPLEESDDSISLLGEIITNADYGALKNVNDSIDRSSEESIQESIEDIMLLSDKSSEAVIPIKADLCVSVKARSVEEAIKIVKTNNSEVKNMLQDRTIIGDIENIKANFDNIGSYNFSKEESKSIKKNNDERTM